MRTNGVMAMRISGGRRRGGVVVGALAVVALVLWAVPARGEVALSSWSARAEGTAVYSAFDLPGTLPFSPVVNLNLSHALSEMSVSQNHALSAPVWPGSLVVGLPGAAALLGFPLPVAYPLYAESYYPNGGKVEGPIPLVGDAASAQVTGGRASSETAEDAATAHSNAAGVLAAGVVEAGVVKSTSSAKIEGTVVKALASTSISRVVIADVLVLEGVSASAQFSSDEPDKAKAAFAVGGCSIAGVPCAVGLDGVTIQGQAVSIPAAAQANAALEALEDQGITVRLGKAVRTPAGIDVNALDVTALVPLGAAIPTLPLPVSPPDTASASIKLARAQASAQAGEATADGATDAGGGEGGFQAAGDSGVSDAGAVGPEELSLPAAGESASSAPLGSPSPTGGSSTTGSGGSLDSGAESATAADGARLPAASVARVANIGPGAVLAMGLVVLLAGLGVGMVAVRRLL